MPATHVGDRPLRIMQVMRAPVGGLFRHVADLSHQLAERGHQVGLVVDALVSNAETEAKLANLAPDLALGIHRLSMPRLLGPGDLTVPFRLNALLRKLAIDIVHGHGAKGGFHARLARPRGVPAFYTPHGGVLHFDTRSPAGRVFHTLERALMRRTDGIFFESAYAQRVYSETIAQPDCRAVVVHNGLREDEFVPVVPDADAADFVFVGELRRLKGVHILLEALTRVRRPDGSPATAHLVGDGPDRTTFEQQAASLSISDRIAMPGAGPARDAFRRGHVVVVPSLAESLPYIIMEAAAAERPVIATRVGGVPEIFGPTAPDLVPADDVGALAEAMQHAIDHPRMAETRMRERLAFVRETFSVARMAEAIEEHYRLGINGINTD